MEEQAKTGTGYLVVQVTTANSAIPLPGASVTVTNNSEESADVLYELTTGAGGRTERIALPTVPRAESEAPGNAHPFTSYNIEVRAPGYDTAIYHNVGIFDGITTFQQANLAPVPANGFSDSFTPNRPQLYENPKNNL